MNSNYLSLVQQGWQNSNFHKYKIKGWLLGFLWGHEIKLAELRGTAFIYFLGKQSFEKYLELEQVTTH